MNGTQRRELERFEREKRYAAAKALNALREYGAMFAPDDDVLELAIEHLRRDAGLPVGAEAGVTP